MSLKRQVEPSGEMDVDRIRAARGERERHRTMVPEPAGRVHRLPRNERREAEDGHSE